jgi:hypothetical protein
MKTFLFTIKDDYENLVSFSLDSKLDLRELVKSKEFLEKLEFESDFLDEDDDVILLCGTDWSCFSTEQNVKGITKHKTFDIDFLAERIWTVDLP